MTHQVHVLESAGNCFVITRTHPKIQFHEDKSYFEGVNGN